ncbi:MAG: type II toxin-antitoxin system RelE/ParE family toxin [Candidatus Omnitrophota bacterium]
MSYQVNYFKNEKGEEPVRDYIKDLALEDKAKVFAYLKQLSDVGPQMRRPMADYMGNKTGLYELRPGKHRVIYFYMERKNIILLHALYKKTDKIPEGDVETALWRKEICQTLKRYNQVDFEEFEEKEEEN